MSLWGGYEAIKNTQQRDGGFRSVKKSVIRKHNSHGVCEKAKEVTVMCHQRGCNDSVAGWRVREEAHCG